VGFHWPTTITLGDNRRSRLMLLSKKALASALTPLSAGSILYILEAIKVVLIKNKNHEL